MTRTRTARPRSSFALGTALLLAAGLATLIARGGSAASAAPSDAPATSDPGGFGNIEIWLDQPIPAQVPAGETILVGLTLWDTNARELSTMNGLYLRLHPATGKARPTEAETRSDWPGHILANVIVPKGGPGAVEAGISGRACTNDGTCRDVDFPFKIGGNGPPPDAPRSLLVEARFHAPSGPVIAGSPLDVIVDLQPRGPWDPRSLGLPDRLVVMARNGTGPDLASAEIRLGAGPGSPYRGRITIPEAGDVALLFAIPGQGTEDDVIQTATTRIKVVPATDSTPAAAVADPAQGDVPWLPIGGGAVLALLASLVIRRVFADL